MDTEQSLSTATSLLRQAVDNNWFSSTLESWINETFRTGPRASESFYGRTLAKNGRDAAETELEEWVLATHRREIAENLGPVVQAMLKVMETEYKDLVVGSATAIGQATFPGTHRAGPSAKLISLFNPTIPGCGCMQPAEASDFGAHGRLGLRAVSVVIDPDNPAVNQLSLVLPLRNVSQEVEGYTSLQCDRDGSTMPHQQSISLYAGSALNAALGLHDRSESIRVTSMSGGNTDNTIGFPGALAYIASRLPAFALYLLDVAEKLSNEHKH